MRKIFLLALFLLFRPGMDPMMGQVRWYSIQEALQLMGKEPKMMVIDVYTDWCGWCKRMDATTFSDPEVANILNKDFYPVKLNAEGREEIVIGERTFRFVDNGGRGYHELAAIVTGGRLSYPTISYVDEQGRVLQAAPGYVGPEQFKVFLAYYNTGAYKTQGWEQYRDSLSTMLQPPL
jgi:thioredoxin-related protein